MLRPLLWLLPRLHRHKLTISRRVPDTLQMLFWVFSLVLVGPSLHHLCERLIASYACVQHSPESQNGARECVCVCDLLLLLLHAYACCTYSLRLLRRMHTPVVVPSVCGGARCKTSFQCIICEPHIIRCIPLCCAVGSHAKMGSG